MMVGDYNGDGLLDLVVVDTGYSGSSSARLRDADSDQSCDYECPDG